MKKLFKPLPRFDPTADRSQVPSPRTTAVAILGSALCLLVAEVFVGDLDAADDVVAIAEGSGRLTAGGLTHLVAAALLGLAVAGLGPVVRGSVVGRVGWALLWGAVPCAGAFAMFHLILVETGAAGLDRSAMQEFVVARFQGAGVWALPVGYFVFLGLSARLLVTIGLVRRGVASAWAPALFAVGLVLEVLLADNGTVEIASHGLMAVGSAVAAYGLWRVGGGGGAAQPPAPEPAGQAALSGQTALSS
ncbi:hypothetical protein [Plantactinospora sonchi]|uniref:DUF4386 domain-containing protein n=1 Tax=Plantactinospora sonchi TaxID=1544735 RepID=A0ABU7RW09_9ACTN